MKNAHVGDRELLQWEAGELSRWHHAKVSEHVGGCEVCRARIDELQKALAEFVQLHRHSLDSRLASVEGPAALLKAELTRSQPVSGPLSRMLRTAALFAIFIAGIIFSGKRWPIQELSPVPRTDLTPGMAAAITSSEACSSERLQAPREVPVALQAAVFEEYGIHNPRPRAYEVDYLITPELGGTSDIRNLWPEPYYTPVWNAHVKDALEKRLHEMVCSGQLDLATAQRDLSTDWIAAYRKYFHANRPLPFTSR